MNNDAALMQTRADMDPAITDEIIELVGNALKIDENQVLPEHTLKEIQRVSSTIGDIATSHLGE